MPENDLAPKAIGKKTLITIIGAIATAIVFAVGTWAYGGYQTSSAKNGIRETLEQYASDINNNSFDATKYFANSVPVYFETKDQTPRLINRFWEKEFNALFQNYEARFDFESLTVDCNDDSYSASILLYSDYFHTRKQQQVTNEKSRYDLKFDKEFRIVEMTQVVGEEVEVR